MVVLSVALCTRSGKSLFARQYVDMTRGRVEGLLAAFPKLLGSAGTHQHTYVETDAVRYVYHPLDKLYIVLITNKHSNIMEDLATLQLLSKLVPDICGSTAYDVVQNKVFDVLFSFDEVITSGGYKEDITLRQVRTNMAMNSCDERLAQLIRQSKINEAKETANAKAKALAEQKRQLARSGVAASGAGFSGSGFGLRSAYDTGDDGSSSRRYSSAPSPAPAPAPAAAPRRAKRGMKLGKKDKKSALQALMQEENIPSGGGGASAGAGAGSAPEESKLSGVDVDIIMSEKMNIIVVRDGSVKKFQVSGTLTLTCNSEDATRLQVPVSIPEDSGFQFQPHPNVSKPAWREGALTLKDTSRTFPIGTPVSLLRWRAASRSDSALPLALNVWPDSLEDGVVTVTVDYTLQNEALTLSDVVVRIPLPPGAAPRVNSCDGAHNHVTREDVLEWSQAIVDATSKEGTLEFEVACDDENAFFPVEVSFTSQQCLCPLGISSAVALDGEGSALRECTFRTSQSMVVAKYHIVDE